ncbi:UNVERIFIED_ORG: hypothetical protein J2791_001693 [Burkholderia contaminans]|nr:hypothetical protein [Burkholderia contaminans]
MSMRTMSSALGRGALAARLAVVLALAPGGCDVLTAPPVPDWPGPHAGRPIPSLTTSRIAPNDQPPCAVHAQPVSSRTKSRNTRTFAETRFDAW